MTIRTTIAVGLAALALPAAASASLAHDWGRATKRDRAALNRSNTLWAGVGRRVNRVRACHDADCYQRAGSDLSDYALSASARVVTTRASHVCVGRVLRFDGSAFAAAGRLGLHVEMIQPTATRRDLKAYQHAVRADEKVALSCRRSLGGR